MHITREFNANEKSLSEKMKDIIIMAINSCNIYETELGLDTIKFSKWLVKNKARKER